MKELKKKFNFKEYLKQWTLFEKLWLLSFTLINIYLFFAWQDSIIGLIASLTGMLCVVLTAKAKISSFYYGIVNILAYSYVAYKSAYFGDVMLNMLYFLPMAFIGIYFWRKNSKKDTKDVIIRTMTWREKGIWFGISIFALITYGLFLTWLNGTLPFIDSTTTVFSIIATIMLTRRFTDQWLYWIAVDVLSVIMWVYIFATTGGDVSMLVMWSAYLVNAVYGYYNWRKMERKQNEE
ncbi:nicotinamide riboside transporter PnuC [Nanoarchaeota archaeon]